MDLCIISLNLNCSMELKQFYNIATKFSSRKKCYYFWWSTWLIRAKSKERRKKQPWHVVYYICSFLRVSPGFYFTPRSREKLPAGFPEDVPGTCYFLDRYVYEPHDGSDVKLTADDGVDLDGASWDEINRAALHYGICDKQKLREAFSTLESCA